MAKRRWPLILFGVAILIVFLGIGVVIASIAWFQQNVHTEASTDRDAATEFDAVREKFAGREPLLEMHDGVPRYTKAREASPSPTSLTTLSILVWDPDEERLARIALPFWLLRMKSDPIEFGAYASGLDDEGVNVRPDDIEKYGPGIILDTVSPSGERVLLWAQ
jgi:hypothetical protein